MFVKDDAKRFLGFHNEGVIACHQCLRLGREQGKTAGFSALAAFDHREAELLFKIGDELSALAVGKIHFTACGQQGACAFDQMQKLMGAGTVKSLFLHQMETKDGTKGIRPAGGRRICSIGHARYLPFREEMQG